MSKKIPQDEKLLRKIKKNLLALEKLLEKISSHWHYEDLIYRFYHQSYKVFHIQSDTIEIVEALKKLAPNGVVFNSDYERIYQEGTGKMFKSKYNSNWHKHTRPMLEAYFHAKYFLEMAIKYGKELEHATNNLPSGWAGLLYFYNLR
jgi:hypothetical protein